MQPQRPPRDREVFVRRTVSARRRVLKTDDVHPLGHAHHSLGDTAEARRQYERALTLYDDLRSPQADRIRAHLAALDLRPTATISSRPPLTSVPTTASP